MSNLDDFVNSENIKYLESKQEFLLSDCFLIITSEKKNSTSFCFYYGISKKFLAHIDILEGFVCYSTCEYKFRYSNSELEDISFNFYSSGIKISQTLDDILIPKNPQKFLNKLKNKNKKTLF